VRPLIALLCLFALGCADRPLGEGDTCRTNDECSEGLYCQYWEPGCGLLGRCLPHPNLDAAASCQGVCDCNGYWRGNSCTPPDAGVDYDGWVPYFDGSGAFCSGSSADAAPAAD
jgi:hypothetical protein